VSSRSGGQSELPRQDAGETDNALSDKFETKEKPLHHGPALVDDGSRNMYFGKLSAMNLHSV